MSESEGAQPVEPSLTDRPSRASGLGDFLAFRIMVSPFLVQVAYVLGVVVLCVVGIDSLSSYFTAPARSFRTCNDFGYCTSTGNTLFIGILTLTAGNLVWRLTCEWAILFFSIHERLLRIERNTRVDRR